MGPDRCDTVTFIHAGGRAEQPQYIDVAPPSISGLMMFRPSLVKSMNLCHSPRPRPQIRAEVWFAPIVLAALEQVSTLVPFCAKCRATEAPPGPEPTMTTSVCRLICGVPIMFASRC